MNDAATPNPSPLISVEELQARLADPATRATTKIADVRWALTTPGAGRSAYETGHLPGAVFVDLDTDLSAPVGPGRHPLPDPADFARALGAKGFGDGDLVVAYDDSGAGVAGRLWWMLDALGHRAVRVLDGGIGAWTAAGGALETGAPALPPATLTLAPAWPRTIDRDSLRVRLGAVRLIDVRAPERYRGDVEPVDRVPGHIPTALNVPLGGNLAPDGRFLPADAIRARLAGLAFPAPAETPVVVSCGSGTNAGAMLLAFRLAGLPDPLLYPGSYSDWSGSFFPIATGDEPGAEPGDEPTTVPDPEPGAPA